MNSLDQGLIIALIPQVNSVSNIIGISFLQEKHRFVSSLTFLDFV